MDIASTLQELYAEKQKLDRVINALEELQRTSRLHPPSPSSGKRRGRKSMSSEERKEVSKWMKKYWANRRKAEQV